MSSEEGVGTDIKVTFEAEVLGESNNLHEPFVFDDYARPPIITLLGFKRRSRGTQLLYDVLCKYLRSWWGFPLQQDNEELGDIIISNEDPYPVVAALEQMNTHRSFIILSSSRGSPRLLSICNAYENNGGFCRIVNKPGGPFRLRAALKQLLKARQRRQRRMSSFASGIPSEDGFPGNQRRRRGSMDTWSIDTRSPPLPPLPSPELDGSAITDFEKDAVSRNLDPELSVSKSVRGSTVTVNSSGTLLRQSTPRPAEESHQPKRVLVVEDNGILRGLLYVGLCT